MIPKMPATHAAVEPKAATLNAATLFFVPPKLGASASITKATR